MASIVCIYCGSTAGPTAEHVVQKSLGGNLTINEVCRTCNGAFSQIDQALSDNSLVSLSRLMATSAAAKTVQLGAIHVAHSDQDDLSKEVRLRNGFSAEVVPQLHLRGTSYVFTAGSNEDKARFLKLVEKLVATGKLDATHVIIDESCRTTRLAQHRSGDLVVRAKTGAAAQALLQKVKGDLATIRGLLAVEGAVTADAQPTLTIQLRFDFNAMYRAIAKIALNYLAHHRGGAYARQASFDPIRRYIVGSNIVLPPVRDGELAIDTRFVCQDRKLPPEPFPTASHLVSLMTIKGDLIGIVTLYARHTFVVKLGAVEKEVGPTAHEFSVDGTCNRNICLEEMVKRKKAALQAP